MGVTRTERYSAQAVPAAAAAEEKGEQHGQKQEQGQQDKEKTLFFHGKSHLMDSQKGKKAQVRNIKSKVSGHRARHLLYRLAVNRLRERRQSSAEVPTLAADD
jgi:hypothetical protein